MNSRNTWRLVGFALALFALIVILERRGAKDSRGIPEAPLLLPDFDPNQVTGIEITRSNQVTHADRTTSGWQLDSPRYPAVAGSVENLLHLLSTARQQTVISSKEITAQPEGLAAFGMVPPRAVIVLGIGPNRTQLHIGG